MRDHDLDYIARTERQIGRMERDMRRAGVYGIQDELARAQSAIKAASVERAITGLDRGGIPSAIRAASLSGVAPAVRDALKQAETAHSAARSARIVDPRVLGAATTMMPPLSASRQVAEMQKAMKAAIGAKSVVEAAKIDTSAIREVMSGAGSARSIVSNLSALRTDLYSVLGQQHLFNDILEAAKHQGVLGQDVEARFLSQGRRRNSPAYRSIIGAATSYGPIVVTPDGPPPSRQKLSSHYNPNLQETSVIPYTAADPDDPISFDAVWAVVMIYAQTIAQHRRTQVVVRFIGDNKKEILIGIATNLASSGIIWLLITLV